MIDRHRSLVALLIAFAATAAFAQERAAHPAGDRGHAEQGRQEHEALREIAFKERGRIHDIIMEGIGLALRKRGYPRWGLRGL